MGMRLRLYIVYTLCAIAFTCMAAEVVELPSLTVEGDTIADRLPAGAASGTHLLTAAPRPVLRSQGGTGAQNDLSVRGSAFSGTGISLGGLALKNPQTEHFHAELPLNAYIFAPPNILTGARQPHETDGHLAASIQLDIRPIEPGVVLSAGMGAIERHLQSVYAAGKNTEQAGWALFMERESAEALDYDDNNIERVTGGMHLQWADDERQSDVLFGHQHKHFGARGYYGVTPDWAAAETLDDHLLFFAHREGDEDESFTRLSLLWRETEDEYTLYWTRPGVYENRHVSTVYKGSLDGRAAIGDRLALRWRAGGENENIDSTNLGDHHRSGGLLYLAPEWRGAVHLRAGLTARTFSDDAPAWLPSAEIEQHVTDDLRAYAAFADTVRLPSYTELNYESPGSLGNEDLDRQTARNLEAGFRYENGALSAAAATFRRTSRNTVDWIKPDGPDDRWTATDIGRIATRGVEVTGTAPLHSYAWITLFYQYLDKEKDTDFYAGRYVWDYARHTVHADLRLLALQRLEILFRQGVQWQKVHPARTSDNIAKPASLTAAWRFAGRPAATLSAGVENLWDDDYEVFAGQRSAGRRVLVQLTAQW